MAHSDELAWHSDKESSDVDSCCSQTSTPGFKRGVHQDVEMEQVISLLKEEAETLTRKQKRTPSVQILADARVSHWSKRDNVCVIETHEGWNFKQWISALRVGSIRITCRSVVLYLEHSSTYTDVPPLKNALLTVCKIIRQYDRNIRIFISNLLPSPSYSPLKRSRVEKDFLLLQAIRSVNRVIGKVHYLSLFEHFVSLSGKIIQPTHRYFREDGDLTYLGCMVMRRMHNERNRYQKLSVSIRGDVCHHRLENSHFME